MSAGMGGKLCAKLPIAPPLFFPLLKCGVWKVKIRVQLAAIAKKKLSLDLEALIFFGRANRTG